MLVKYNIFNGPDLTGKTVTQYWSYYSDSWILRTGYVSGVDTTLEITPFHASFNTFTITLSDAATGSLPQNMNAVYLRFTNPGARIGPIVPTLNSTSGGRCKKVSRP